MYKRQALAFLCDAYEEEELEGGDTRVVLHLHPALAPFKAAVLPLQKNKLGDKMCIRDRHLAGRRRDSAAMSR